MKCIVLWEPWATLMAIGAKTIETRAYPTSHTGPLAIASGKRIVPDFGQICHREPFRKALVSAGYDEMECYEAQLGKIIAYVDVIGSRQVNSHAMERLGNTGQGVYMIPPPEPEFSFGNYAEGRHGWLTKNPRKLARPIPIVGRQRVFNVPLVWCDSCDGTGSMEGWGRRDGRPCPKCWGDSLILQS